MRLLRFDNGVTIDELPRPVASSGAMVIRVKASLLFGDGETCCAGIVIEQDGTDFSVGDRVTCIGQHAEFILTQSVARIPKNVPFEEACYAVEGAHALQGVRRLGAQLGETVAVSGLGLVGQLSCQLLRASGATVLAFDPDEEKVLFANRHWGVEGSSQKTLELAMEKTTGNGCDGMLITDNGPQSWDICKEDGNIVVMQESGLTMPATNLTVRTCYKDDITEAEMMELFLNFLSQGKVSTKPFTTHQFPFDKAKAAYGYVTKEKNFGAILMYNGATTETTVTSGKRANGKISTALIGAGHQMKTVHLPILKKMPSFSIQTIVSRQGGNAKDASEKFGIPTYGTDYREAVKGHDLVMVCTRNDLHAQVAIAAAKEKASILCEQPLALTEEDLHLVVDSARQAGVFLLGGSNRRFSPLVKKMMETLGRDSGTTLITYRVSKPLSHTWVLDRKEGGGIILGDATMHIDLLNALIGVDPVETVVRTTDGQSFLAIIKYADGSIANLVYTTKHHDAMPQERLELFKNGTVMILDDFVELFIGDKSFSLKSQNLGRHAMLEHLDMVISGKGSPTPGLREGALTTLTALKMDEAMRSGVAQRINTDWL